MLKGDLSYMEKVPASPVSMFLCFQIMTSGVRVQEPETRVPVAELS